MMAPVEVKVGDFVALKKGTTALKVSAVHPAEGQVTVHYTQSELDEKRNAHTYPLQRFRFPTKSDRSHFSDFNMSNPVPEEASTMSTTPKLYRWLDANNVEVFGTRLTTDSRGKWIMEPKGGGNAVTIDKAQAERVMPYTVGVAYNNDKTRTVYNYFSRIGEVEVGDVVFNREGAIAQVVALDTKSDAATKWLEGFKVKGTALLGELGE